MSRLKNKIAIVTGASSGIGAATATLFAQEGAKVIILDIEKEAGLKIANTINADFYTVDVSKEQEWESVTAKITEKYKNIDILVNNAGITGLNNNFGLQDPEHASLESWDYVHKINLDSVFLGCRVAIKLMKEHGGSIVNVSSRSGMVGIPGAAAYASSKAAIRNHSKTVALYCAQQRYNIRCNSVHPGAILTPMWDAMLGEDRAEALEEIASGIPLGHMGEPLDVAYAILYFVSNESKYITGAELTIDGGILAGSSASPAKKE